MGPAAPVFLELDQSREPKPELLEVAKAACQSCVQLPHCTEQRQEIVTEIKGQATGSVVVAAEVAQPTKQRRPSHILGDTRFIFDLSKVPEEPRHKLEIIRQAFRTNQLSIPKGKRPYLYEELSAHLDDVLTPRARELAIPPDDAQKITAFTASAILKYRAFGLKPGQDGRWYPDLKEEELQDAIGVHEVVTDDFLAISDAGFKDPALLLRSHKPAFYTAMLRRFVQQDGPLSVGVLRDIFRKNVWDPRSLVEKLTRQVDALRRDNPEVSTAVLVRLVQRYHSDIGSALELFYKNMAELRERYGEYPYFTTSELERLASHNPKNAMAAAELYLQRLEGRRAMVANASGRVQLRAVAGLSEEPTDETLERMAKQAALNKYELGVELPHVKPWMRKRLIELYDLETIKNAARYTDLFLGRGYLVAGDGLQESLYFGEGLDALRQEEREAILAAFKLDRLVLGREVDREKLQAAFGTPDLERYVDELLPYVRLPKKLRTKSDAEPQALLYMVRHWRRDNSTRHAGNEVAERWTFVQDAAEVLIESLVAEGVLIEEDHRRRGIIQLVDGLKRAAPELWNRSKEWREARLLEAARAYLADLEKMKTFGFSQPYRAALSFSATYCDQFMRQDGSVGRLTRNSLKKLLQYTERRSQPLFALRQYQALVAEMTPRFRVLGVAPGYCRSACLSYLLEPSKIEGLLQTYEYTARKFATNVHVGRLALNRFCFTTRASDPAASIKRWLADVGGVPSHYKQKLGIATVKRVALSKSGRRLTEALDGRLQDYEELTAEYRGTHLAVDDEIIKRAVNHPKPEAWIKAYIERWDDVNSKIDVADITSEVLRRLIATYVKDPLNGVQRYRALCERYEDDEYIERWMIDEAVVWDMTQAEISLRQARRAIIKNTLRLDEDSRWSDGSVRSWHESIPGSETIESILLPEESSHQNQIASLFRSASDAEKAAVAVAYDLPWMIPENMRDEWDEERVCGYYGVRTPEELQVKITILVQKIAVQQDE